MSNTRKKITDDKGDFLNAWGFLESREEKIVDAAAAAFRVQVGVSATKQRTNAVIIAESAKAALEALKEMELTPIEHAYLGMCVAHAYHFFKNELTRRTTAVVGHLVPGKKGK